MSLTCPVSFPVLCFMCCWRMLNPLWPVVWKLQKSCDSFDPLRCKACAQLSEKARHEVRAQATQQVSNETRAAVLEKVGQELTLPWKQEKKWKEMKRNEKEHSGPSNFCAFSSSRHYIMASIEAPPTRSVNTFKELSLSHMDLQVSSPTSVPALYKGILQHSWEAAHGLRVYSFTSCTLQTQGWTNVSQHQHHSLKSIPGLPQSKRWRAQEM